LQTSELQTQLAQARLEALQMQLNPHFLFNTLNTISALIHDKPEEADRMVVRLSELLRLTLDRVSDHLVPLRLEVAMLERYIDIERIRFEDRLQVEMEIEPGIEEAAVPCLMLQPIVENAIRHGIDQRETGGRVSIRIGRRDDRLAVRVTDNGPGLPGGAGTIPPREGVGLSNTRARLRHLYGDRHRFDIGPGPDGGVQVLLEFPWEKIAAKPPGPAPRPPASSNPTHVLRS
jgi:sensor histidine kinase YesM